MNRSAFLAVTAIAALLALPLNMAAAKSKAYCRQWAQTMVDRTSSSGPSVGATAGNVLTTVGDVLVGTVTVNQAMPSDAPRIDTGKGSAQPSASGTGKREQAYRRAYAECRAS